MSRYSSEGGTSAGSSGSGQLRNSWKCCAHLTDLLLLLSPFPVCLSPAWCGLCCYRIYSLILPFVLRPLPRWPET